MKSMRVKINFRLKSDTGTWKVFTVQRVPGKNSPKQIHLGYVPSTDIIRSRDREKLVSQLRRKCKAIYGFSEARLKKMDIDWSDADEKFRKKMAAVVAEKATAPVARLQYPGARKGLLIALAEVAQNLDEIQTKSWLSQYANTEPLLAVVLAVAYLNSANKTQLAEMTGYSQSKTYHWLVFALSEGLIKESTGVDNRTKYFELDDWGRSILTTPPADIDIPLTRQFKRE
ncbi:hypothetical protein O5O45_12865 [Hahella aquimaris]|uniref:hypothetical protein n=1 Tax=Hahella sp. HNIBRBA332 TaxID=3015983 RepID=UPI00273BE659|nr:hypothetical protein [Hahella sp. HNIBRBA332]WLQ16810.1 hypothetical protein O5O45_12865 [Hahella sp. HNIBRBA332]